MEILSLVLVISGAFGITLALAYLFAWCGWFTPNTDSIESGAKVQRPSVWQKAVERLHRTYDIEITGGWSGPDRDVMVINKKDLETAIEAVLGKYAGSHQERSVSMVKLAVEQGIADGMARVSQKRVRSTMKEFIEEQYGERQPEPIGQAAIRRRLNS